MKGVRPVRVAMSFLFAAVVIVSAASSARAAQMGPQMAADPQAMLGYDAGGAMPGQGMPSAAGVAGADCPCVQQPPWHGNVRGPACPTAPRCRGSNVYQANPMEQLQWRQMGGCTTLPPCLPRLHAFFCQGYLLTPVPPALPRCHNCGTPIEGGF